MNLILDKGKSKSSDTGEDLLKMETDADTSYQLTATFVVQPKQLNAQEKKKFISLNSSLDSALAGQHQSSSGIPISDTNRLPASNVSSDDKDLVGNNKKLKANQGITGRDANGQFNSVSVLKPRFSAKTEPTTKLTDETKPQN
ncbi:hypothetical protein RclHR1_16110007 [Rhizophagus clarus]|uniref:Uncharacterized protein n=1 Tax=Rhizophagus clarus TaxID=94130 RepID=A0A2Z6QGZ0_9GLOM|nr:hypothetical protein RclHR1_16110007 [Rhizophagus clarus]